MTATATRPKKTAKPAAIGSEQMDRAAQLFKLMGDSTRLGVVLLLDEGERHVGAICEHVGQAQPCVSHHLNGLRLSRILKAERRGKQNVYALTDTGRELAKVARVLVN